MDNRTSVLRVSRGAVLERGGEANAYSDDLAASPSGPPLVRPTGTCTDFAGLSPFIMDVVGIPEHRFSCSKFVDLPIGYLHALTPGVSRRCPR